MKKNTTAMDNAFAQLRNLSEYAGALKFGREFKTMVMADESIHPDFKLKMVNAIDDAMRNLNPPAELSDTTVGDVLEKMEKNEII